MTQEMDINGNTKHLLIKDLCCRLPYGVKVQAFDYDGIETIETLYQIDSDGYTSTIECDTLKHTHKPYLFPLSSMTGEQRIELYKVLGLGYESHYHLSKEWEDFNNSIDNNGLFLPASWVSDLNKMYNWLNKNHFDYQGLIPMKLANDATGLNIY